MKQPVVSVITTVYNAQEYLNMAIDSILNQTYKNFEFLIIDDGSTDNSGHIIEAYSDPRIKYISQKNKGLSAALNRGIAIAKGKYIARMDHDDISYPTRLEEQVEFLQKNRKVAMVGTSFDLIDTNSGIIGTSYHLDRNQDIQIEFLVRNPFGHGTVVIRRQTIEDIGGYDINQPVEDYELWWRVAQKYEVANLPRQLYGYRILPTGMSHGDSAKRQVPITKFMEKIWSESRITKLSRSEFIEALNHYRDLGPAYREQYLYMMFALTLGLYKMGYAQIAINNLTNLLRVRGATKIFGDFRKNPFSHNYNWGIIKEIAT
jgi:glycosyltransferase involved in cell wall biosynthesis